MTDFVAADITGQVISRNIIGNPNNRGANQPVDVHIAVSVSTGTNADYDTGTTKGLPMTNFFTAGQAQDTGLDVTQPIYQVGGEPVMVGGSAGSYKVMPIRFANDGTTAATQGLRLFTTTRATAANTAGDEVADGSTLTGANYFGGAGPYTTKIILRGTIRPGFSLAGTGLDR